MDRVVSSYTPTIRALRCARQHPRGPASDGRSLIVAMPVTQGLPGGGPCPAFPRNRPCATVLPHTGLLADLRHPDHDRPL